MAAVSLRMFASVESRWAGRRRPERRGRSAHRLVSDLRHVLDRSRVPAWLGARCWVIRDLLSRSDAVNTGGVEECSGGQAAAVSAQLALPGFGSLQCACLLKTANAWLTAVLFRSS